MDASDWDQRYGTSELMWSAGPNQFVEEYCSDLTPGRALDVAGGEGRNAIWLARRGWDTVVSDFSQVALDKGAHVVAGENLAIEWRCDDVTAVRYEPRGYDLVLVCYLQLPHDALAAAIERAASAVAEGGRMFVVAHALENLRSGTGGPSDPAVLQTPEQLRDLIEANDLIVERATMVERQVNSDEGNRTAIDVVVTAHRYQRR